MKQKRNGLLEIYRFLLCFLPLYYHNFFFWERNYEVFGIPELAVDFFFMLSGFFLIGSMRKLKEEKLLRGTWKMMFGRLKPMLFTLCFIVVFNAICILLFVREDYFGTLFDLFKYWWFVLYLTIGIGVFYLIYRLLRKEGLFVAFLVLVALGMATLQYFVLVKGMFFSDLVFPIRTFGCLAAGMIVSYIPGLKKGRIFLSILAVAVLFPTLIYLMYSVKNFWICILIISMFGALMYFSANITFGGKVFDLIGQLSVRMYLYMAFVTMLRILGLSNYRILFVIDVTLASLDLCVCYYRDKYFELKKQLPITDAPKRLFKRKK